MSGATLATIIPFLIAAMGSTGLLIYFWREWQRRKQLLNPMHSVMVQADIKGTRIERQKNNPSGHVVDCDFKDWKGTTHSVCYTVAESDWKALQEQSTVSVTYLREMPTVNCLTDQIQNRVNSYRFLVLALASSPILMLAMAAYYALIGAN